MDENDISDILTSDRIYDEWMSELNEKNEWTSHILLERIIYILYVTAIYNVFYALNVTIK